MTPEEQLAEAVAFVEAAYDGAADIIADSGFTIANLMDGDEVHLRCYVAMVRARDRLVAVDKLSSCGAAFIKTDTGWCILRQRERIECHMFDGLVCPEHREICSFDPCFSCAGCGRYHADCQCGTEEWERRTTGQRIIIM